MPPGRSTRCHASQVAGELESDREISDGIATKVIRIVEPISQAVIAQQHGCFAVLNGGRSVELPNQLPLDWHFIMAIRLIAQHALASDRTFDNPTELRRNIGRDHRDELSSHTSILASCTDRIMVRLGTSGPPERADEAFCRSVVGAFFSHRFWPGV